MIATEDCLSTASLPHNLWERNKIKKKFEGKIELRKIGNRARAILIVTEKGAALLNPGHFMKCAYTRQN